MPGCICAFDIGTTGVKAGLLTADGQLIGHAYREYRVVYPAPQWVEQSIEEMWQAQCDASREMMSRAGLAPEDVAAVAVSCQRATFVPLDRRGTPLTRFIGWQDQRSAKQCEDIRRLVGDQEYYRICGLPIEPTASLSKILWLRENRPDTFEDAAQFASTQNVHLRQMGVEDPPCDLADAAYIGLLDVDNLSWSKELLRLFDIPQAKLPHLAPSGVLVGEMSREAASALGLAAGTPIVTAGGDLQCAGVGVGVTEAGRAGVGIGTGADVVVYLDRPTRHPEMALNCLPHAMDGAWEMEGICLASGAAYKWFRDTLAAEEREKASQLGLDSYTILNAAAESAPPGSGNLIVLPALAGSGAPHWDPSVRGVVLGLSLTTDKRCLARAVLEGVCFEIRWMLEAVKSLGMRLDRLHIYGGAAKSRLWNQISADIYGLPISRPEVEEGGLVGAAICAGVGVGLFKDAAEGAESMIRIRDCYEPNPKLRGMYDEMFEIYKDAYVALSKAGIFIRLASLGRDAASSNP